MFQRILVPLDGSLRAERALPVAVQIARASQGMLVLLRVVSAGAEDAPPQSLFGRTLQSQMEEAQQYLTALASSRIFTGISLIAAALPGAVVPTTQAALHTYQADLLVLCEQSDPLEQPPGMSGLAGQLIEHGDIPLLLIPSHAPDTLTERRDQRPQFTVLVALDGPHPSHALMKPTSLLLTALAGQGQRYLRFVPLCSSDFQVGAPVLNRQSTDRPASSAESESRLTKAPAVSLKECVTLPQQTQGDQGKAGDLLVLEIPPGLKSMEWIERESMQHMPSGENIPLFLVPSDGKREP